MATTLASHQKLLARFSGTKTVDVQDPFWHELLSFTVPLTKIRPADLEDAFHPSCAQLVVHNDTTHHFGKLLVHLVEILRATPAAPTDTPLLAINALYFTRVIIKYFTEHTTGEQMHRLLGHPSAASNAAASNALLSTVIETVFMYLIESAPTPSTFLLHTEAMNLLLVMASTQLTSPAGSTGATAHPFLATMMTKTQLAPALVKLFIQHYIARAPPPPRMPVYAPDGDGGVLARAGSVLLMPFTMPFRLVVPAKPSGSEADRPPGTTLSAAPLADGAILLLLVLVHHDLGRKGAVNPYRTALDSCRDTDYLVNPEEIDKGVIRVSYNALFNTIGSCLVDDRSTLMLYSLIHGNAYFLEYVLVRTDLDTLLMPLLEMLYNAPKRTANQIYMLLIILLILSQDSSFNANIHKLVLPAVPWYQERLLPNISLGSLVVVILIRTVKYNLSKLRDVYLHTNCLAALANMAPHVQNLNSYASQRLVSLFDMLARKYSKLQSRAKVNSGGKAAEAAAEENEEVTELNIYTDFLRIVLEIVNAILTYALPRNPEVVYALMHRQELFLPFKDHPRFVELLENIQAVLNYFNTRMDESGSKGEWSVEKVLSVVTTNARAWRGDGIKLFTELRFTYEEEAHPEEFFVPYVWSLVCKHSGIPWDPAAIALFTPPVGGLAGAAGAQ